MSYDGKVFFVFPFFDAVYSNLVPGELTSIYQVKQIGMIVKELQRLEIIFSNYVFVDVAVVIT